ncbi:MAG: hypothetical protein IJT01_00195, partial [Selenomonadaceae bacterium]|nr:hypothetical protein [Selenomonadaceae bacterium]
FHFSRNDCGNFFDSHNTPAFFVYLFIIPRTMQIRDLFLQLPMDSLLAKRKAYAVYSNGMLISMQDVYRQVSYSV